MTMDKNSDKKYFDDFTHRFGTIAVEMDFVTIEQVLEVLSEQVMDNHYRRRQKKIGRLMIEKGLMSSQQVDAVLEKLAEENMKAVT